MKILIAIKSSWRYLNRRDACRATWMQGLDRSLFDVLFIVGRHTPTRPFAPVTENLHGEQDVMCTDVPDDFRHISPKISIAARLGASYDHLAIMDDDTYLRPERLPELAEELESRGGSCIAFMRPTYPQGAMYLIDRSACLALGTSLNLTQFEGPDDVCVGLVLNSCKLKMLHTDKINPGTRFTDKMPLRTNDVVSTHKCLPPEMHIAHRLWTDSHANV